jgi:hypothetical protein
MPIAVAILKERNGSKLNHAKSPVLPGLLMVGARGFEPPTPSLPDYADGLTKANGTKRLVDKNHRFSLLYSSI